MQQERMGSEQADQALAEAIKHKKFRTPHRSRQKGRGLAELRDLGTEGITELRSLAPHERQQRQYGIGGNSSSSARLAIISCGQREKFETVRRPGF